MRAAVWVSLLVIVAAAGCSSSGGGGGGRSDVDPDGPFPCTSERECPFGWSCVNMLCAPPAEADPEPEEEASACILDDDCPFQWTCNKQTFTCEPPETEPEADRDPDVFDPFEGDGFDPFETPDIVDPPVDNDPGTGPTGCSPSNTTCPGDNVCNVRENLCRKSCAPEAPACPTGLVCGIFTDGPIAGTGRGLCVPPAAGAEKGQPCDTQRPCRTGLTCYEGACVGPCAVTDPASCEPPGICHAFRDTRLSLCVPCGRQVGCEQGKYCQDGVCVAGTACTFDGGECGQSEVCDRDGFCKTSCTVRGCDEGLCNRQSGLCEPICQPVCAPGRCCNNGRCGPCCEPACRGRAVCSEDATRCPGGAPCCYEAPDCRASGAAPCPEGQVCNVATGGCEPRCPERCMPGEYCDPVETEGKCRGTGRQTCSAQTFFQCADPCFFCCTACGDPFAQELPCRLALSGLEAKPQCWLEGRCVPDGTGTDPVFPELCCPGLQPCEDEAGYASCCDPQWCQFGVRGCVAPWERAQFGDDPDFEVEEPTEDEEDDEDAVAGDDDEVIDAADDDDAPPVEGRIVITEVFARPSPISAGGPGEEYGEWIELTNVGGGRVNLRGWRIADTQAALDLRPATIDADIEVAPGRAVLLGRETRPAANGGVSIDFAYVTSPLSRDLLLDAGDAIVLQRADGGLADRITLPAVLPPEGVSWQLSENRYDATANDDATAWCNGARAFGDAPGALGTPRTRNDVCPGLEPEEPEPADDTDAAEDDEAATDGDTADEAAVDDGDTADEAAVDDGDAADEAAVDDDTGEEAAEDDGGMNEEIADDDGADEAAEDADADPEDDGDGDPSDDEAVDTTEDDGETGDLDAAESGPAPVQPGWWQQLRLWLFGPPAR